MKIAFVLPSLECGGAERAAVTLAKELRHRGHQIDFVLMQAKGPLLADVAGCGVHDLGAPRIRKALKPLAGYIASHRPDAMIAYMWPLTTIAVLAKWRAGKSLKLILSDHTFLSRNCRGILDRIVTGAAIAATYPFADARHIVSDEAADDIARMSHIPRRRFAAIGNPVEPPRAPQGDDEGDKLWGVPRGGRILTVGSLRPEKNHALLLGAFARLWHPKARLMIVGDGPERGYLDMLIGALNLRGRVIMAGFQSPAPFYRSADLFVLSSDFEGLPTVLIEALGYGLPVVSTDCRSGPREILKGGELGTLVPPGDQAALAVAMIGAFSAKQDKAALIARAADYRPDRIADRFEKMLAE